MEKHITRVVANDTKRRPRGPVTRIVRAPNLQPYGGFIPPKEMEREILSNDPLYMDLVDRGCKNGGLQPQALGLVFDYILRTELAIFSGVGLADAIINAFKVSCLGAKLAHKEKKALALVSKLASLDEKKKKNYKKIFQVASELVVFDAVYRAGYYNPDAEKPKVNDSDEFALSLMLNATEDYLLEKQKLVSLGFEFTARGAENVTPSDGDILTTESLIDIKCSINKPTSKHTLQLLLYYILGLHEYPEVFKSLKYIKILNPRLGIIYSYELGKVDIKTLKRIEGEIMGYKDTVFKG